MPRQAGGVQRPVVGGGAVQQSASAVRGAKRKRRSRKNAGRSRLAIREEEKKY